MSGSRRAFTDHLRFSAGEDEVVIDGLDGRVHVLSQVQARVLSACRGSRSLDEHAALAARALGSASPGAAAARSLVETLALAGLLPGEDDLRERAASARVERDPPAIEMLGIPTNGRPAGLRACLAAHGERARAAGRSLTFVVADGAIGDAALATAGVLRELAAEGLAIRTASRADRERFAPLLASRSRVDRDLVDFALLGDARLGADTGANRNAVLLDAAGTAFVFTDDDVRPRAARAPRDAASTAPPPGDAASKARSAERLDARAMRGGASGEAIRFVSGDPSEMWFADPGAPIVPDDRLEDVDPIALHASMLGADVAGEFVAAGATGDASAAGATFFRRLFRRGGRVAITQLGSAGDHGMASSFGLLLLTGASRARLVASEARFLHAITRRIVRRSPAIAAIADGASFMPMSAGLDARSVLPPFAPAGRDSDGLFGALVRMCVPDAFSGHLPWAIEHVPEEPRVASIDGEIGAAGRATINELVRLALTATFDARDPSPEILVARAGRTLIGLASRPREADDFFREHVTRGLARRLAQIERLLAEQSRTPSFWAAVLDRFALALRAAIASDAAHVPFDLVAAHGLDRARSLLVEHVARVGRLLEAWPALFDAARDLRVEGRRLSRETASP